MKEAAGKVDDSNRLLELTHGYRVSQAIHVIVALGIPDLLRDRRLSCRELAARSDSEPRALYRLLRALAAAGLVREEEGESFSLTSVGKHLRSDVPSSRAAWVENALRPLNWHAWGHLLHSIKTGETAFEHVHGEDIWSFRSRSAEDSAVFDLAMREGSRRVGAELLASYDFAQFEHIVDVGGGDGTLLATLLAGCSEIRGTLFDQAHVVANAPEVLRRARIDGRCGIVAGSFFDAVPNGADAYLLKFILHDWGDDHCARILANCRRAMVGRARLLIVERLLAPPNQGLDGKLSDLNMMVNVGGQERSQAEFATLLQRSGLVLCRAIGLPAGLSVLDVAKQEGCA
mgnify:CR=1 FL=1